MAHLGDFFGGVPGTNQSAIALDAAAIALGIDRNKLTYWVQNEVITDPAEVRVFNKIAYYAPQASLSNPITCLEAPELAPVDWVQFTVTATSKQEIVLGSGETEITFDDIDCTTAVFYIDGDFVDSGRISDSKFTVLDRDNIILVESFPQGTLITGYSNLNAAATPNLITATESILLTSGQLQVQFTEILATPTTFYICGEFVDSARLCAGVDYTLINSTTIILTSSYPDETILVGVFNDTGDLGSIDYNSAEVTAKDSSVTKRLDEWMADGPVLTSPNGTKFVLSVADNGDLTATEL